mgnify:CR=1 FL=1|jgi:hypothetical protein|tara:strand:+ start:1494 stop:1736 length:243 start_codon:yes stop_codon:yes gene_type:complete
MAVSKSSDQKGTPVERQNIQMNGTYLGSITLWDDSSPMTVGMFKALQKGANINGLTACSPAEGGKTAAEIEQDLMAQYAA